MSEVRFIDVVLEVDTANVEAPGDDEGLLYGTTVPPTIPSLGLSSGVALSLL